VDKNKRVKSIQKFLKQGVKWKPFEGGPNWKYDYNMERYLLLEGCNEKNPRVLEVAHFINDLETAKAIFEYNPSYYQALYDIDDDFKLIDENFRKVVPHEEWWKNGKQ